MNGIMLYNCKSIWQGTPRKLQEYYREPFSGFFLRMKSLFPGTINDSNIDLDKFPASKVRTFSKEAGNHPNPLQSTSNKY